MWGYQEFLAKAKLYFGRAADDREYGEIFALWSLLGLEFFLRAPLAKVHASLLAVPEGDSILHAAGIVKPNAHPKSIQTKTVVDRLRFIDPNFGEDRAKDALFLADLRNGELHSADAVLANALDRVWIPKFLEVVRAVCEHLEIPLDDLLDSDVIEHAEALKATADRATLQKVQKAIKEAKTFFGHLTEDEIEARVAKARTPLVGTILKGDQRRVKCPACELEVAALSMSAGKTLNKTFDEDKDVIISTEVHLCESLACPVCSLELESTAEVMAAGFNRLWQAVYEEDRYEGWEDLMTYEDAIRIVGESYDGEDYGND